MQIQAISFTGRLFLLCTVAFRKGLHQCICPPSCGVLQSSAGISCRVSFRLQALCYKADVGPGLRSQTGPAVRPSLPRNVHTHIPRRKTAHGKQSSGSPGQCRKARPGDIAKELGVDSKEVSKAIAELKKEGKVMSPKRCYYARRKILAAARRARKGPPLLLWALAC